MEKIVQLRLDADVSALVRKAAKRNERSVPREANLGLRNYYRMVDAVPVGDALSIYQKPTRAAHSPHAKKS